MTVDVRLLIAKMLVVAPSAVISQLSTSSKMDKRLSTVFTGGESLNPLATGGQRE